VLRNISVPISLPVNLILKIESRQEEFSKSLVYKKIMEKGLEIFYNKNLEVEK
jgi:hypothetical protein